MATLRVKNKYGLTFKRMLEEGSKEGGIPDKIVITPQEAWDVLNELLVCNDNFRVIPNHRFEFRVGAFNKKEALEIINEWIKSGLKVRYNSVPVIVEVPKKPDAPKPEGPPNETIKPMFVPTHETVPRPKPPFTEYATITAEYTNPGVDREGSTAEALKNVFLPWRWFK